MKSKAAVMLSFLLFVSYLQMGCREIHYIDVSEVDKYAFLVDKTFLIKSRMLVQSFKEVSPIVNTANGKEVTFARLLGFPGLNNRHLKWTIDVPAGERFAIARVIKFEVRGGYTIYYKIEFENFKQLDDSIVLLQVSRPSEINDNAGIPFEDFKEVN